MKDVNVQIPYPRSYEICNQNVGFGQYYSVVHKKERGQLSQAPPSLGSVMETSVRCFFSHSMLMRTQVEIARGYTDIRWTTTEKDYVNHASS